MRKIGFGIGLFLLLMILPLTAQDQNVQQLFRQGNLFFQQGKYQQAVEAYQKILEQGYESGELYYNLGNAYFKINQFGKARLFYERALRFMPDDEALKENLILLKRRLVDRIEVPPKFFLTVWWEDLLQAFSLTTLTYLVIIAFWMLILSWAFYLFMKKQRHRERGKGLVVLTLILLILLSVILTDKIYRFEKEKYGVILKPSVTVFSEPRKEATEIFVVHEGTKVKILRKNQNWLEIKLGDGKTGWLRQDTLETI